jgi:hypothetical protein
MRRLIAVILFCAGLFCLAQSERTSAFWQSRDSNYNQKIVSSGGATTFDPAHIATGWTLTNGNLTASSATNAGRTNTSHSSGKFYWEFIWNTVGAGAAAVSGFGNGSAGTTGYQIGQTDNNSYGMTPNAFIFRAVPLLTLGVVPQVRPVRAQSILEILLCGLGSRP